jgi:hypothetical protein
MTDQQQLGSLLIIGVPLFLGVLIIWSAVWKGLALWHSARQRQPWWFVILMFVNTLGILDIIYLFGVAKVKGSDLFSNKA